MKIARTFLTIKDAFARIALRKTKTPIERRGFCELWKLDWGHKIPSNLAYLGILIKGFS